MRYWARYKVRLESPTIKSVCTSDYNYDNHHQNKNYDSYLNVQKLARDIMLQILFVLFLSQRPYRHAKEACDVQMYICIYNKCNDLFRNSVYSLGLRIFYYSIILSFVRSIIVHSM